MLGTHVVLFTKRQSTAVFRGIWWSSFERSGSPGSTRRNRFIQKDSKKKTMTEKAWRGNNRNTGGPKATSA
jgi:hypothetical protein